MGSVFIKRFLAPVILLMLVIFSCGEVKKEIPKPEKSGRITEKIIFFNNGLETKDTIISQITKLNKQDMPVEVISYDWTQGGIRTTLEYEYNPKGKMLHEKLKSYVTGLNGYSIGYEYDERDRNIKRTTYDEFGNIINEYHNEFKDTLRIKELQYLPDKTLLRETKLFYDSTGNLVKTEGKYFDKPLTFRMIYKYNKQNKKISEEIFRADDGVKMQTVNKIDLSYDEKGNITKQTAFDGFKRKTFIQEIKYNGKNLPVERAQNNFLTKEWSKTVSSYNDAGKISEEIVYSKPQRISHKIIYFYADSQ